jgi:hypothetical protein
MTPPQLPNYLVSNRKRLALSQADVAFLLEAGTGEQVSRHERFVREPSLATALAYEVVYKRSVSELFSGMYQKVEQEVAASARSLAGKTDGRKSTGRIAHRRNALAGIAGMEFDITENNS